MAFKKQITARGVAADYFRLVSFRWDERAREASALFSLYVDEAHAGASKRSGVSPAEAAPLVDVAAKIRLSGDEFDRYVGKKRPEGADIVAGFYRAAREACKQSKAEKKPGAALHLVSDYGEAVFDTAADV